MKMYIEADMQDKIHEFFGQMHVAGSAGGSDDRSQIFFNIPELERYLD